MSWFHRTRRMAINSSQRPFRALPRRAAPLLRCSVEVDKPMMRGFVVFCFCMYAAGQSAPADLRGIYIYTNDVSKVSKSTAAALTSSFAIPGVDGVALVIGWNAIEPAMGEYQWDT